MYYSELLKDIKDGERLATFDVLGGFIHLQIKRALVDSNNALHLVMYGEYGENEIVITQHDTISCSLCSPSYTISTLSNRLYLKRI